MIIVATDSSQHRFCFDSFHDLRDLCCGNGPAVNDVIAAVNRSGAFRREESHQLCDLFRLAWPAQGNAAEEVHDLLARSILVDSIALANCMIIPWAPEVSMKPGEIRLTRTPLG